MADKKWDPEAMDRRAVARALTIGATTALVPVSFEELRSLASDLAESGLISRFNNRPAQAGAAIQAGLELGIAPMQSLKLAYSVHGNLGWEIKAEHALVVASDNIAILRCYEHTESACTWVGAHANDADHPRAFRWTTDGQPMPVELAAELKDLGIPHYRITQTNASKRFCWVKPKGATKARRISYMERDSYQNQPGVMLHWRALGQCLRYTWPEVLAGVTSVQSLRDRDEEPEPEAVDAEVARAGPRIGMDPATKVRFAEWVWREAIQKWEGRYKRGRVDGSVQVSEAGAITLLTGDGAMDTISEAVLWAMPWVLAGAESSDPHRSEETGNDA